MIMSEMRKVHLHVFFFSIQSKVCAKTPMSRKLPFVMSLRAVTHLPGILTTPAARCLFCPSRPPHAALFGLLVQICGRFNKVPVFRRWLTNRAFFTGGCKQRVKRAAFLVIFYTGNSSWEVVPQDSRMEMAKF